MIFLTTRAEFGGSHFTTMKQYSLPIGIVGAGAAIPVSPHKSLIFTFPATLYASYGLDSTLIYVKFLGFTVLVSVQHQGIITVQILRRDVDTYVPLATTQIFAHYDENTVIRMDLATPGTLKIYANEQFAASTNIANSLVDSAWATVSATPLERRPW